MIPESMQKPKNPSPLPLCPSVTERWSLSVAEMSRSAAPLPLCCLNDKSLTGHDITDD
jgi:hypothetical protein